MELYDELRRIVGALEGAGIRYALVGGLAVGIYAEPRATQDIDLLVAGDDLDATIRTLAALDFRVAGASMDVARGQLRIQRMLKCEGADLLPVDLLIPQHVDLARLLEERTVVEWEGDRVAIVSVAGLRVLKRLRGSTQDRADLEALGPEP